MIKIKYERGYSSYWKMTLETFYVLKYVRNPIKHEWVGVEDPSYPAYLALCFDTLNEAKEYVENVYGCNYEIDAPEHIIKESEDEPAEEFKEDGSLAKDLQIEKLLGERDKLKEGYSEILEELGSAHFNYELLEKKYEEAFAEGEKLEEKYEYLKAEMEKEDERYYRLLSHLSIT